MRLTSLKSGRNFNFRVDPTNLPPGLHCAQIKAYDTANKGRLVFSVPITVCKPEGTPQASHTFKQWHSTPGQIERKFLVVPEGATWAGACNRIQSDCPQADLDRRIAPDHQQSRRSSKHVDAPRADVTSQKTAKC